MHAMDQLNYVVNDWEPPAVVIPDHTIEPYSDTNADHGGYEPEFGRLSSYYANEWTNELIPQPWLKEFLN